MNQRENLMEVLNHGNPEWMPMVGECLDIVAAVTDIAERPAPGADGKDWFGVTWKSMHSAENPSARGFTPMPGTEVLTDICDWREVVKFPDIDAIDWTAAHERAAKFDRENKVSLFFWESGPFERIVALMGFEEALVALASEPEEFAALLDAITEYKLALVPLIAEHYQVDMVCVMDDVAHGKGTFMSAEVYREMILPRERRIADAIRDAGMMYMHHCCGHVEPLLEDMLTLEPLIFMGGQAQCNDQAEIERRFGDRVAFFGGLNAQIIGADEVADEDVVAEVRRCIDTFAPYRNLIFDSTFTFPDRLALIINEYKTYTANLYV